MKVKHPSRDKETAIYTYLSRRSLMKLIGSSVFGMGFWISACDPGNPGSARTVEISNSSKMNPMKSSSKIQTRIPAIDAAAPAETETATFALG